MSTVQKLPPFTLLDVTVSSPAEMIAAIDRAEGRTTPQPEKPRAWQITRLADGRTRLTVWGKPAGTYPTRAQAVAIRDRLLAMKGTKA